MKIQVMLKVSIVEVGGARFDESFGASKIPGIRGSDGGPGVRSPEKHVRFGIAEAIEKKKFLLFMVNVNVSSPHLT